jgi:PAS domain S-box-containing protein
MSAAVRVRPDPLWRRDPAMLAWPVLACGLLLTLVVTLLLWQRLSTATERRFSAEAGQLAALLEQRMRAQETVLRAAAALVRAQPDSARASWRDYLNELDVARRYPGTAGVGLSLRAGPTMPSGHEPATPQRGDDHALFHIEPMDTRQRDDIGAEPVPAAAMAHARDTGQVALSGRVVLGGPAAQTPGFVLVYPIRERDAAPGAPPLRGYAFSAHRAAELFGSVLGEQLGGVAVDIHDGAGLAADSLLYRSAPGAAGSALDDVRTLTFGGHEWTLHTRALPGFAADYPALWLVPALGGVVSALLFHLLRELSRTRRAGLEARAQAGDSAFGEQTLATVLDTAAEGIVTTDEAGVVLTVNRATSVMFDVPASAVADAPLSRLIPELDAEWFAQQSRDAAGGQPWSVRKDVAGQHRNGERFPLALSGSRFSLHGRLIHTLVLRDVSEQVEAQIRMRLHDRALASSNEAVIIRDVRSADYPVVYVNDSFARLTGQRADEVIGGPFSLVSGELNPEHLLNGMREAIDGGKPFNGTAELRRADGRPMWIALSSSPVRDQGGVVTHYIDVFGDITERVEFEQKLIRRTNRLHAVFALSPDGFVTFGEDGILTNVNPAFTRMTNLSQRELRGLDARAFDRLIESMSDPAKPWPMLVLDRSTEEPQRLWLLCPEPRVIERSARVAPQGRSETVLYFRDITQQFEVDRMKSEFLSTAAHELRTPLASIFGFAELLINRDYDESSRRRMHGIIHRQSRVLVNLINDLLDLARIEVRAGQDFRHEDESARALISATLEGLAMPDQAERLTLDIPPAVPRVRIDHEKMVRVLTNVIANAFKYSPGGGEVRLSVREATRNSRLMAGIRVTDHGIGMTPAQQARIFERFYRADPSGAIPGTGLGMSLVKEIMDLHGGEIDIDSEPGFGTSVTLWLPVMDTATT